jgi:hypothetical protein
MKFVKEEKTGVGSKRYWISEPKGHCGAYTDKRIVSLKSAI